MILESLNQVKEGNNYKSVHLIILEKGEKIVMGRGHEADVRINDISVSRMHGTITLEDNDKILLRDLGSKFGTLALIQKNWESSYKKTCLQIGRSYMEVKQCLLSEMNDALKEQREQEEANIRKEKEQKKYLERRAFNPDNENHFDLNGIKEALRNDENANELRNLSNLDVYNMLHNHRNRNLLQQAQLLQHYQNQQGSGQNNNQQNNSNFNSILQNLNNLNNEIFSNIQTPNNQNQQNRGIILNMGNNNFSIGNNPMSNNANSSNQGQSQNSNRAEHDSDDHNGRRLSSDEEIRLQKRETGQPKKK